MKFMKLGSRPNTFYTTEGIRSVSSEVSSDIIVQVKGTRYMLHKFPLLSKCLHLQRLCAESPKSSPIKIVQLPDFPGGVEAFELCAKFCYGITITLSSHNIVSTRCAAEYLQMTEDVDKGNLVYKLDVFLNSCLLQGWKDSIVTLQSTKPFHVWSEELGITSRCIEAIASKVLTRRDREGWWAEDMAELSIDLYWRTMIAIKSSGKVPSNLIGDALKAYAAKWLPRISSSRNIKKQDSRSDSDSDSTSEINSKHRLLLESIVSLLPLETGAVSCSFLLKLLKASNILNASSSSKMELARRVGLQLEEAAFSDLLIPSSSNHTVNSTIYDVDIVMIILEQFMLQGQSPPTSPPRFKIGFERRRRSRSAENIEFEFQERRRSSSASSHSSKLKVAKLVDRYLQEVAKDVNLSMSKFITMAETIPGFARPDHDDLYRAIDIYLKAHPELSKSARKRLCRILDCRKLSGEACVHAAQNDLLPLRVVVQVLVFEQARAALAGGKVTELPSNLKALLAAHNKDPSRPQVSPSTNSTKWSVSGLKSPKSSLSTLRIKLAEDDDLEECDLDHDGFEKSTKFMSFCALPARPKRLFSKLWSVNRNASVKR